MKLVLVVDDEAALLDVFAMVISDLGHRVLTAHDGLEALALARTHLPDLVVSDHMMPRLTGLDLLRLLRGEPALSRTPFILVSAATPRGADEATASLTKPVSLENFERVVQAALKDHPAAADRERPLPVPAPRPGGVLGGEMLAWVAHEIKTPLSAARINLQLIQRELGEQPRIRRRTE
ncbi:MAG: response regulator, partial [Myxococcaceae bacterium]